MKKDNNIALPFANVPRLKSAPQDNRPVVKLANIEGQAVLITGVEPKTHDQFGEYLLTTLQVSQEVSSEDGTQLAAAGSECVLFLRAQVLTDQLNKVEEFPVVGCVKKAKKPNGRSCWLFVDPDDASDPFEGQ